MWMSTLLVLVLTAPALGSFAEGHGYEVVQSAASASLASTPTSSFPAAARESADFGTLEVGQALAIVSGDVAASVNPRVASTTSSSVPITASSISRSTTVTSTSSSSPTITSSINTNYGQPLDYTTTKWVETWVGGTYSTWTPTVITVIHKTPAPAPPIWHGEVGMGSLTGETGVTQTVFMGAAPSQPAAWARRVVAAVGVGVVGIVV